MIPVRGCGILSRLAVLAALLVASVTSVAFAAGSIDPKRLERVDPPTRWAIDTAWTYAVVVRRTPTRYTVPAGIYTAEYRGKDGVFLRGPDKCVEIRLDFGGSQPPIVMRRNGGIVLSDAGARIYFYRESDGPGPSADAQMLQPGASVAVPGASPAVSGVGSVLGAGIVNAIIMAGMGHIHFPKDAKPDPALKALLRPVEVATPVPPTQDPPPQPEASPPSAP